MEGGFMQGFLASGKGGVDDCRKVQRGRWGDGVLELRGKRMVWPLEGDSAHEEGV
ncbi:hypothetical protein CK203_104483 [Vitis vinifera]|uniref:Uncharacterized protein n=1 Tax=Vitis vinifera TaxID=29760 RepID=A0A438CYM6_VITVI|nr:hypothetical protein CK203_104483 [Vitis vinifera]